MSCSPGIGARAFADETSQTIRVTISGQADEPGGAGAFVYVTEAEPDDTSEYVAHIRLVKLREAMPRHLLLLFRPGDDPI